VAEESWEIESEDAQPDKDPQIFVPEEAQRKRAEELGKRDEI
jgi:hypothetical protein